VEDNASENGLFPASGGRRVPSLPVSGGVTVRIGRTQVRIVDPTAPIAPTLRYGARLPGLEGWLEAPRVALLLAASAVAIAAWRDWAGRIDADAASTIASAAIGVAAAVAVWSAIWAFLGRGSATGGRFTGHVSVAAGAVTAILLLVLAGDYADFLWPEAIVPARIVAVLEGSAIVALFAGHLFLTTRLRRWRLLAASLGVTGALVGVVAIATGAGDSTDAGFSPALEPIRPSLIPAGDPDRFFQSLPSLKAAVDSLASDST
jgi:hypothetical protein